ncbi:ankyrin repeat-containing domain protein, partial [Baffinella frigidus]
DFFSLVRHNKVTEVDGMLAGGFPIDKRDGFGNTCLMVAAQNGHKRIVKMALKYQADPNSTNHHGNTSLHFATSYGYSALSKYLIGHGADDTLMN